MVFPVVMYGCESWTIKKAECWIIDAFELWCWRRLLRIHWIAVRPNQSTLKKINSECSFIGRTDAETEAPILWPPDTKSWLTGKDPDAGKDWRQREKRVTEDEVVGWHHWLNGYGIEQILGVTERQGSLACCKEPAWGCKELDTTWQLKNNDNWVLYASARSSHSVQAVTTQSVTWHCQMSPKGKDCPLLRITELDRNICLTWGVHAGLVTLHWSPGSLLCHMLDLTSSNDPIDLTQVSQF